MSLKISSGPLFVRIGGRYVQTEHTVEEFDQLRADLQRLQSSPAPVGGGVPDITEEDYESVAILMRDHGLGNHNDESEDFRRIVAATWQCCQAYAVDAARSASRLPAIKTGEVVRWIPVEESLPEDGATVGFITECARDRWYHGRVLGGRYMAGDFGGFSVPGLMVRASYWFPFPPIPDALRAQATTTEDRN